MWLWPVLGATVATERAQDRAESTPPAGALPPNIIVSSGPMVASPSVTPRATPPAPAPSGQEQINPRFLGALSCSSSLCHGGGSPARNAYTIWAKSDPHRRAPATLAGTRAKEIAEALALGSAVASTRCTECHQPLATVPAERLAPGVDPQSEGVSCESCHGPAQNWVRSHTRRDFSPAQNAQTGVREERSLYGRANTCVACHQVLAPDLLAAGHPALFFELDSQMMGEPRHWVDAGDFFGPQAWLVGQAVALRESTWALAQNSKPSPEVTEQWGALEWLLRRTMAVLASEHNGGSGFDLIPGSDDPKPDELAAIQRAADNLARTGSTQTWTSARTRRCLLALAALDREFSSEGTSWERAERLTAALARLLAPLQRQDTAKWDVAARELDALTADARTRSAFRGADFGVQLRNFHDAVALVKDENK